MKFKNSVVMTLVVIVMCGCGGGTGMRGESSLAIKNEVQPAADPVGSPTLNPKNKYDVENSLAGNWISSTVNLQSLSSFLTGLTRDSYTLNTNETAKIQLTFNSTRHLKVLVLKSDVQNGYQTTKMEKSEDFVFEVNGPVSNGSYEIFVRKLRSGEYSKLGIYQNEGASDQILADSSGIVFTRF